MTYLALFPVGGAERIAQYTAMPVVPAPWPTWHYATAGRDR